MRRERKRGGEREGRQKERREKERKGRKREMYMHMYAYVLDKVTLIPPIIDVYI